MKCMLLVLIALTMTGCGRFDRWIAGWTGDGVETCHAGVAYVQFTSGTSVKYNQDGSIATCKE